MQRDDAWQYVAYCVDDSLNERKLSEMTDEQRSKARLVGWQCGPEPMFVAVFSYLPNARVGYDEAEDLASDLLTEKRWFANFRTEPDYIL